MAKKKKATKPKKAKRLDKRKDPKKPKGTKTVNSRISNYYPTQGPVGYSKINYGGG